MLSGTFAKKSGYYFIIGNILTTIVDLTAGLLRLCVYYLHNADGSLLSRVLFGWTVENDQFETVICTLAVISLVINLSL